MKKPILPVWGLPRPGRLAAPAALLLAALCGCGTLKKALAPAPRLWPEPREHRVRKDGLRLRAYGGSFQSPELAAADARDALRRYLVRLDIPAEPSERKARVEAALKAFPAVPAPSAAKDGHAALIEVELPVLQKFLGTRYDD